MLLLWALRSVVSGQAVFFSTNAAMLAALGLFGLFLIAAIQLCPLPKPILDLLSPQVGEWVRVLIPVEREQLVGLLQPIANIQGWSVGDRFSLNPSGSYRFALRVLALFGLFLAVCSLSTPRSTLYRVSIAAVICGSILALVSILQILSSPTNLIYWYFESRSGAFGPFINRNHYPFFANLALGLSVGLLLHRRDRMGMRWFDLFQDATSLWLITAIGLIATSVILSVSRGGVVALVASISVCFIVRMQKGRRAHAIASLIAIVAFIAVLLVWIGFNLLSTRLAWLFEADRYNEDGRWYLWETAVSTIRQFPLLGSGGETFRYWETMLTSNVSEWNSAYAMAYRADNEFLDIGAEYGLISVFFLLSVAASVLQHGFRVSQNDAIATGGLMGMTAVIVHSCFDFGLRMPASAVFAVIVAALLCSMKQSISRGNRNVVRPLELASTVTEPVRPGLSTPTWGDRCIAIVCAASCALFVAALVKETRRYAMSDAYRLNSLSALKQKDYELFLDIIQKSVAIAPEVGQVRIELARSVLFAADGLNNPTTRELWIKIAMEHCIAARELSPLAWEPHLWLAQHHSYLTTQRPRLEYFQSARLLHPADPDIAFATGAILFDAGSFEEAWQNWKGSLVVSKKHLAPVMRKSRTRLTAEEQIEKIIPGDSSSLNQAASIAKSDGNLEEQQAYLKAGIRLLADDPTDTRLDKIAARAALAGEMHFKVGERRTAIESYQTAVRYEPKNLAWRIELIRLLISAGSLDEARRQTRTLLALDANNSVGEELRVQIGRLQTEEQARR